MTSVPPHTRSRYRTHARSSQQTICASLLGQSAWMHRPSSTILAPVHRTKNGRRCRSNDDVLHGAPNGRSGFFSAEAELNAKDEMIGSSIRNAHCQVKPKTGLKPTGWKDGKEHLSP